MGDIFETKMSRNCLGKWIGQMEGEVQFSQRVFLTRVIFFLADSLEEPLDLVADPLAEPRDFGVAPLDLGVPERDLWEGLEGLGVPVRESATFEPSAKGCKCVNGTKR